jgi:hypothetical protein
MTPQLTLPNAVTRARISRLRRRGWGAPQNHETDARAANTAKPSYQVVGSTYTTTTTNYILLLFYGVSTAKTNLNLTVRGGASA